MGLFNLIKLANDYSKAKKYIKKVNADKVKINEFIGKLQNYIEVLEDTVSDIRDNITKVKATMVELARMLQDRKEG